MFARSPVRHRTCPYCHRDIQSEPLRSLGIRGWALLAAVMPFLAVPAVYVVGRVVVRAVSESIWDRKRIRRAAKARARREKKPGCPNCDGTRYYGFDWASALKGERGHGKHALYLERERALRSGFLYACRMCGGKWYLVARHYRYRYTSRR